MDEYEAWDHVFDGRQCLYSIHCPEVAQTTIQVAKAEFVPVCKHCGVLWNHVMRQDCI